MHLRERLLGRTMLWKPEGEGGEPSPEAQVTSPPPASDPPPEVKADPPPPAPEPPKQDWKDARIAELTAKLNAEKAKRVAAAPDPAPAAAQPDLQAQIDAEANRRAGEIAAQKDWDSRCNAVNDQGMKDFPDWADRLNACKSVVNGADPAEFAQFNSVIAAAMETGEAHKLLHSLGESPGEFKRLMGLPPVKMAMEIAGRAAKLGAGPPAPEPSGAPKPITPIGSKGNHYEGLAPDTANGVKLPIGEWMRLREKQAEAAGIQ